MAIKITDLRAELTTALDRVEVGQFFYDGHRLFVRGERTDDKVLVIEVKMRDEYYPVSKVFMLPYDRIVTPIKNADLVLRS